MLRTAARGRGIERFLGVRPVALIGLDGRHQQRDRVGGRERTVGQDPLEPRLVDLTADDVGMDEQTEQE